MAMGPLQGNSTKFLVLEQYLHCIIIICPKVTQFQVTPNFKKGITDSQRYPINIRLRKMQQKSIP